MCNLFYPFLLREPNDMAVRHLAAVLLEDTIVDTSHGRNLWQVRDADDLSAVFLAHLLHDACHAFGYLAAHARVDLVEDDGGQTCGTTDECLETEHHAGYLTSAGHLRDRLQRPVLVGTEQVSHAV